MPDQTDRERVEEIRKQSESPWANTLVCTKAFEELCNIARRSLDENKRLRERLAEWQGIAIEYAGIIDRRGADDE